MIAGALTPPAGAKVFCQSGRGPWQKSQWVSRLDATEAELSATASSSSVPIFNLTATFNHSVFLFLYMELEDTWSYTPILLANNSTGPATFQQYSVVP